MPNGRHGSALIPRDDLRGFFESVQGHPVVGQVDGVDVVLTDVIRLIRANAEESVFVEGQDLDPLPGTALVIHFRSRLPFGVQERRLWITEQHEVYESHEPL